MKVYIFSGCTIDGDRTKTKKSARGAPYNVITTCLDLYRFCTETKCPTYLTSSLIILLELQINEECENVVSNGKFYMSENKNSMSDHMLKYFPFFRRHCVPIILASHASCVYEQGNMSCQNAIKLWILLKWHILWSHQDRVLVLGLLHHEYSRSLQ